LTLDALPDPRRTCPLREISRERAEDALGVPNRVQRLLGGCDFETCAASLAADVAASRWLPLTCAQLSTYRVAASGFRQNVFSQLPIQGVFAPYGAGRCRARSPEWSRGTDQGPVRSIEKEPAQRRTI
jgi:hypothetical protein